MNLQRQSEVLWQAHGGDAEAVEHLLSVYAATIRHFSRRVAGDNDVEFRDLVGFVTEKFRTAIKQARPSDYDSPMIYLRSRIRNATNEGTRHLRGPRRRRLELVPMRRAV